MLHIYNFALIGILLCNLLGVGLACHRLYPHYALARIAGPVVLVATLFCLEHAIGLGSLFFIWPITTALSVWLTVKDCRIIHENRAVEIAFALGFLYPLIWRYGFPDIDSNSERLTNLGFISAYLKGGLLPPTDQWLPPYKLNIYYTLQHYAAALLGRCLGLDAGTSYNLSFCTINALTIAAAYGTVARLAKSNFARSLSLASFVFGGTGVTLLVFFMMDHVPDLWAGMRFIGDTTKPDGVSTAFGKAFVAAAYSTPQANPVKMPMENFAYLMSLGDYHAPLSGFLLMALGLLATATLLQSPRDRSAVALLSGSAPLMLAANTWLFPLQSVVVLAYIVFEFQRSRTVDWAALTLGAGLGLILIFPFLKGFAVQALDFKTSLRLVPASDRTPLILGLALHWPLLLVLLLGAFAAIKRPLVALFTILFGLLSLFSELVYVDDIYSGEFNRFNTTLKWWPYVQAGTFITLGTLLLDRCGRFVRWTIAVVFIVLSVYAGHLAHYWITTPKSHFGRLDGSAWLTDDASQKAILDYLKAEPDGIVLERLAAGGFTYAPALSMFSGHPAMLGWYGHEQLWRGYRSDILTLYNETTEFYKGAQPKSVDWLRQHEVRFIVWLEKDNVAPFTAYDAINEQIKSEYVWIDFHSHDKIKVGIWVRRSAAAY